MGGIYQTNSFVCSGGNAYIDVSTKKYPDRIATIDAADLPLVLDGRGRWCVDFSCKKKFYVVRGRGASRLALHRHILGLGKCDTTVGDHKNGNGLDNRRYNLRVTDDVGNARNTSSRKGSTSRFLGVYWFKSRQKWRVECQAGPKRYYLGLHDDEIAAARAYDDAARLHFGEFAKLNFPDERVA